MTDEWLHVSGLTLCLIFFEQRCDVRKIFKIDNYSNAVGDQQSISSYVGLVKMTMLYFKLRPLRRRARVKW